MQNFKHDGKFHLGGTLCFRLESELMNIQKQFSFEKAESMNLRKEKSDLKTQLDDKIQVEQLLLQVRIIVALDILSCAEMYISMHLEQGVSAKTVH